MKCVILFIAIFATGSNTAAVPSITPCLRSDSACILNSANKVLPSFKEGIKDLDIPAVDPVFIKEAVADFGDLKLKLEDLTVVGLSKAELVEITRDDATDTLKVVIDSPVRATGTYTAGGKLLFVDIEGHGDILIKTDKIRLEVDVKLEKFEKDSKSYYKIGSYDFKYDIKEDFEFNLDNLFNGDEKKAEPILKIIRENWRQLLSDIGKPVIKEVVDTQVKSIEKFVGAVPISELQLDA